MILDDLGLLETRWLFLNGLDRCEILGVPADACSAVEVFLVAFVVLEETLIDTALVGISSIGDIDAFTCICYILIVTIWFNTLGFLPQVLAH